MKIIHCHRDLNSCDGIEGMAANILEGGIVIIPTDTIYGLACDAANQSAVERLFAIKNRDKSSTMAVMVGGIEDIYDYAEVGDLEKKYLEEFLPGPVTVILKANENYRKNFSPNTINSEGGVGFRVVSFKCIQDLCRRVGRPIALTSANKSKAGSYVGDIGFVREQLQDSLNQIDILIDAGNLGNNSPSMVIDLTKTPYEIIRLGGDEIKNK